MGNHRPAHCAGETGDAGFYPRGPAMAGGEPGISNRRKDEGDAPMVAMHSAGQRAISDAAQHISIPRRFSQPMREIWEFQLRLQRRTGRKAAELVEHRRFRAAYDFLLLREQAGEDTGDLGPGGQNFRNSHLNSAGKSRLSGPASRPKEPGRAAPNPAMIPAYIALGSNLGNPKPTTHGRAALEALPDSQLQRVSSIYRSAAVGPGEQPDYLNAVLLLTTSCHRRTAGCPATN